ncbi:MAG: hypothetical protein KJ069_07795 [Anaerolineae bacterium]|nr:hypothetical protein [Anaerolineae bacterium]
MTEVEQIKVAIKRLSQEELEILRQWWEEYEAQQWDEQIEHDILAGKLDALADEAIKAFREGNFSEL